MMTKGVDMKKLSSKTPTWHKYYNMKRIPRFILDFVKERLAYDRDIELYTAVIKSNELLEKLSLEYKGVNNAMVNSAFYRLKDAGWFQGVVTYTGPESQRKVIMDPALIMTAEELEILEQKKAPEPIRYQLNVLRNFYDNISDWDFVVHEFSNEFDREDLAYFIDNECPEMRYSYAQDDWYVNGRSVVYFGHEEKLYNIN